MWYIGINTFHSTLRATKYQFIRTTGLLVKNFKTYKAQLWYKKIFQRHITLYVYYLNTGAKSARGFIAGTYIPIIWVS